MGGEMHVEVMHKGWHVQASPTFQESVSCHWEEGQLQEGLAENERLEPLGRVHHHGVSELLRVPPEHISQLQNKSNNQCIKVWKGVCGGGAFL